MAGLGRAYQAAILDQTDLLEGCCVDPIGQVTRRKHQQQMFNLTQFGLFIFIVCLKLIITYNYYFIINYHYK